MHCICPRPHEQGTGAKKAAAALDSFANITHGFAALLAGDCFEDVIITTVTVSQSDTPIDRRVPNLETSSVSYRDNVPEETETVPSAIGLTTGGSSAFLWIVTFTLITALGTCTCTCLGLKLVRAGGKAAAALAQPENDGGVKAEYVDGSVLDTPKNGSSAYGRANRMFSPRADGARGGNRKSAAQKRAALNARMNPNFGSTNKHEMEDFEVLSSASESKFLCTKDALEVKATNPMFGGAGHVPRLSALDFSKTSDDQMDESARGSEFWRRRDRGEGAH